MTRRAMALIVLLPCLAGAGPGSGQSWMESVEFPWNTFPKPLWERELAWLKNIGIAHVSLPPGTAAEAGQLMDAIRIVRRLNLEADLEGPVPEALQLLLKAHGGPLTEALPGPPVRLSALAPDALIRSRQILAAGQAALLWTDIEDTIAAGAYGPGAVSFAGTERAATLPLRRDAQLSKYLGSTMQGLREMPGAGTRLPAEAIEVRQFAGENGVSFVSVANNSAKPWTGEIKAFYPALKRVFFVPGVTVAAHDSAWLPVNIPLTAGALCKDCTAFATVDHLVYATSEMTAMEYENGILAMEFSAPVPGEVILQVSREPSGPLVAGGRPTEFDWDESAKRVRLPIPAGKGAGDRVRIGLAIEAPDATAFFDSARVLLIGETNELTAQFSSDEIGRRSRLRTSPELPVSRNEAKESLKLVYHIKVPDTAVHGDHAELALEADGAQMSHARPQLLRAATLRFADAIGVTLAANSTFALSPAVVPVNQRSGRELTVTIRNNAPAIRNYRLALQAEGLIFSPETMDVPVGASASRDVSFRVFPTSAAPGLHAGELRLTGDSAAVEPVRFLVVPPAGEVGFEADGFRFIESEKARASFLGGRWLEYIGKDNGQNRLPPGGRAFDAPADKVRHLADLEAVLPKTGK